jgi:hypothetical protein
VAKQWGPLQKVAISRFDRIGSSVSKRGGIEEDRCDCPAAGERSAPGPVMLSGLDPRFDSSLSDALPESVHRDSCGTRTRPTAPPEAALACGVHKEPAAYFALMRGGVVGNPPSVIAECFWSDGMSRTDDLRPSFDSRRHEDLIEALAVDGQGALGIDLSPCPPRISPVDKHGIRAQETRFFDPFTYSEILQDR